MNNIFFVGVVESRQDPLKLGRMQVRVFGVHTESLVDIPTASLPWAIPLMPATSASLSGIGHSGAQYIEGTLVFVFFQDGESRQQPIIMGSAHGIPLNQSPFGENGSTIVDSSVVVPKVSSSVKPTSENTVVDSSGTPVTDSSGEPVSTGTPDGTTSGKCCTSVDTSKMVAKFGNNVSLVCKTLCDFGIKDSFAIIAILSNIAKECLFVPKREDLIYKTITQLRAVWPSKFNKMSDSEASQYLKNEKKLANFVYSNSEGNGSVESGDGYNYRGRGFIQLTKKNNYAAVGSKINVDLVGSPDKAIDPTIAAKVAAQYFINRFNGANRLVFSSLDEALRAITNKINPGRFNIDYPKVVEYSKLFSYDEKNPEEKKAEEDAAKPNNPENDVKKDATKSEIDSGIVGGKTTTTTFSDVGFADPNKKYPLNSYLNEQDTNRLSRRNVENTQVTKKQKNRRSGIRSIGSTFNEPAPAYNGEYPYNHVYSTESGHLQEFDDTPGRERIHTFHTSGTYQEIDKFGNQVNKIIGDKFSIIERNGYVYIDGTARITIGSDVKLVIGGNLDIEVDGNVNYNIGGDLTWKVGGDVKYGIGGKNSISSGGNTDIDSPNVYINSGTADAIGYSSREGKNIDYPLQIPENFLDSEVIQFDDSDESIVQAQHQKSVAEGTVTQKDLDDGKVAKPEVVDDKPPADIKPIDSSCSVFTGKNNIPESTQLSKNFTLAMLSTKAKAGSHKVIAQHGLSEAEIVCNLKQVAENCLDVIKVKYPNMFVTSGFRRGNSTSQHELGQACDMQFTGVTNSGFFEIAQWIKANVVFDKLLLEYKTIQSGNAWIHVSFKKNPRKEVYTYMNNSNTGAGLRKLQ